MLKALLENERAARFKCRTLARKGQLRYKCEEKYGDNDRLFSKFKRGMPTAHNPDWFMLSIRANKFWKTPYHLFSYSTFVMCRNRLDNYVTKLFMES